MKTSTNLLLLLSTTLVASEIPSAYRREEFDDGNPLENWPKLCDDNVFRSPNKVWEKGNLGSTLKIFATAGDRYEKYVANETNQIKSFPRFIADSMDYNFNWNCDGSDCEMGDTADDKCKESKNAAYNFLYLESARNYWMYLQSFMKAIVDARSYISGQIPSMFDDFGDPVKDDEGWSDTIGMLTGVAGIFAALLPPGPGTAAGIGLGLIDTFTGLIAPEQEKEEKFDKFAEASSTFSDNVDKIISAINDHIKKEYEQPLEWEGTGINAITTAIYGDSLFKLINTGEYAGRALDGRKIDLQDRKVRGSLAAPLINAIWRRAKVFVIRFDGKGFQDAGIDLCAEDDTQIGCKDDDKSLYMIAQWSRSSEDFHNVKGMDRLENFKLSPADIIAGVIKNHDTGGYDYKPGAEELFGRVKESGHDGLTNGLANVWNLPFCVVGPRKGLSGSLQEKLKFSALGCMDQKDKNGKPWPWGKP